MSNAYVLDATSLNEVYKAGSTGKNTTVSGHSDLDIVVALNWRNPKDFNVQMYDVLKELEKACRAIYFPGNIVLLRVTTPNGKPGITSLC